MSAYSYLDQLIDEKFENPIKNWFYRYLIFLHKDRQLPFKMLPSELRDLLTKWEDEMEVSNGSSQNRSYHG